jgi:hypothetical protein
MFTMLYAVLKPPRQERRMSMLKRVLGEEGEEKARRGCLQRRVQKLLVLVMADKRGWMANYRNRGGMMTMLEACACVYVRVREV